MQKFLMTYIMTSKRKLMAKGVPEEEIAFIHEANTEIRKAELFAKVRSGQVRFCWFHSKMGAGTNVQDKLIALHHLDVPWRPSDIEQQEGRILRQGNENRKSAFSAISQREHLMHTPGSSLRINRSSSGRS